MSSACMECRFFCSLETTEGKETLYGLCRRNPPIPDPHNPGMSGFPTTYSDFWCGEFVARLASEPLAVITDLPSREPAVTETNS